MKYSIEQLQLKLLNDIKKDYPNCSLKDDKIIILNGCIEVVLPISMVYDEYQLYKDYDRILTGYSDAIKQVINESKFEVNYYSIFPMIRSKDFGKNDGVEFHRKNWFLDLDILLVSDLTNMVRYLSTNDIKDSTGAFEAGMFNINKITNSLERLNPSLDIYTTKYDNDYNCSLILNHNFKKQIKKIFPFGYLIAIPSGSSILIGADYPGYSKILRELILTDNDPNKVSNNVYRFINGNYEYAE